MTDGAEIGTTWPAISTMVSEGSCGPSRSQSAQECGKGSSGNNVQRSYEILGPTRLSLVLLSFARKQEKCMGRDQESAGRGRGGGEGRSSQWHCQHWPHSCHADFFRWAHVLTCTHVNKQDWGLCELSLTSKHCCTATYWLKLLTHWQLE